MALTYTLKQKRDPETGKLHPEGFIYLRYSYKDFQDCLISTGIKIPATQWDKKKKQPKKIGRETERKLHAMKAEVLEVISELTKVKELPIPEEVKKRYNEQNAGIFRGAIKAATLWEEMIKEGEGKKAERTILNERDSRQTFIEFCESINKPGMTARQITKDVVTAYEKFLSKYKDNTRAKKLKQFKAFLRYLKHDVADVVKFKEHAGDKIYLTEPELTAIETHPFPAGSLLARARDLLSLQCETGLRVSDLMRVGPEHIQGGSLLLRAQKNDEMIRMPISAKIREIISRYDGDLPRMPDQVYNRAIKEVAAAAIPDSKVEITERKGGDKKQASRFKWEVLTSHCAVRTFINLSAARGMPVVSIAALTGKSVATLLKSYLKPNAEQAYQDAITYGRAPMAVNR